MLGTRSPLKNSGSHIDASLSRQPLVKGERLVRLEVNAVIECRRAQTIGCCFADSRQCLLGGLGRGLNPQGWGFGAGGFKKEAETFCATPPAKGNPNPLRNPSSKNGDKTFCATPPPKGAKTLCATTRRRMEAKPSAQPPHRKEPKPFAQPLARE
jgi:hypothetical protein